VEVEWELFEEMLEAVPRVLQMKVSVSLVPAQVEVAAMVMVLVWWWEGMLALGL